MTLTYDTDNLRKIAPDAKGYRGQTAISLGNGREIVIMNTGRTVDARLKELAAQRLSGAAT